MAVDRMPVNPSAIIEEFNRLTPGSKRIAAENRKVLADKSSIGMPFSPEVKEALYPIVAERAEGAYLWDVDGNRYVDILMGLGSNLFGHNPDFIRHAMEQRLTKGFPIGPQSELAGEAAGLFCKLTGMERVTFSNTGTEAVMAAIRVARTATGRMRIARFTNSYHGHADPVLTKAQRVEYIRRGAIERTAGRRLEVLHPLLKWLQFTRGVPSAPGVPPSVAGDVMMLDYGNPRSLEIIRRKAKTLAAVLVEPVQSGYHELQPREFLHSLREITAESGIVLIFDEMITGFRIHQGGAQAHFGIEADIATYSKIAGGGMPLSIIAGRNGIMNHIDGGSWSFGDDSRPESIATFFSGTFCRHPLALEAALATARKLTEAGPQLQERLNARTAALVERLNEHMRVARLPVTFAAFGSFFGIARSQSAISQRAINLLSILLLTRGVHLRGGDRAGFLSTAHSDADIDHVFNAFAGGLDTLAALGLISPKDRSSRP
ncbi:aminotransferase class III-fold pyridoxal phosphate-dependent enzyme [Agrobacterium vitis]|uniref:aspartate aminotransferase family protein n=1 Tax=Rhizobium/Agrobacterium group TaxID=227290 RepID=UPI0012E7D966|nr:MULTISPECIES: aminotransferase class III-fold pyridoxal phosphate-dependent enzyme [Rhizobium/Agrobacterium group]MCF1496234.1 aminotransferase class III-fold pyridoxal phosphate-dependent enzyme [Allorhizobium ampelinum]MVA48943.1 aminotransferase class III-fold pyridoxal phosphate-dependent enzyme [Agrobacterium vitis]